jgi:hypothetical protein
MTVIKLPTAPASFYTVCKVGRYFAVTLVTPCTDGKALKTNLFVFTDKAAAILQGKATAEQMQRPFKIRRANFAQGGVA